MRYCNKCVYPEIAVNIIFDGDGICSACISAQEYEEVSQENWQQRKKKFIELLEVGRKKSQCEYDCIIPVSGGKDSYFQTHMIKNELGFNPLLVTYHGNNYLPEGQGNLDRMREVFGVDHVIFGPSIETIIKLNRVCYKMMGDMNWHNHAGIFIVPMIASVKFGIPVIVWGEIAWDIAGMFSFEDHVFYSKRMVIEHNMRGFTYKDMIGQEGLEEKNLTWLKMPADDELIANSSQGLFLGNYFPWNPNKHAPLMVEKYAWEKSRQPFERTYRRFSNLDDMHENGIHDYLKFIKFGYGRASDHASKDIRTGYLTRKEGIEMVRNYDHVKPMNDLNRWLNYVGLTETEFDKIADTFRDPRVWSKNKNDEWIKDNIWDYEQRKKDLG